MLQNLIPSTKTSFTAIFLSGLALAPRAHADNDLRQMFVEINAQIDERLTTILCIDKARMAMETYEKAIAALSSGEGLSQEKGIGLSFQHLLELRKGVWHKFEAVLAMGAAFEPRGAENFTQDMMALRQGTGEIHALLAKKAQAEAEFLAQLSTARGQLEGLAILLKLKAEELAINGCGVINIGQSLLVAKQNTESWIAIIDSMNQHIVKTRNEALLLVEDVHNVTEKAYEQKIIERLDRSFIEIWHKVRQLSALEQTLDEKLTFEYDLAKNGYDDRLHSKFLQYRASIATMAQKIERGETILAHIHRYTALTDVSRYEAEMKFTLANIRKQMNEVETAGWQGCLQRQILLNNKRQERAHLFSSACQIVLAAHLDAAKHVDSVVAFSSFESKYIDVIRECNR